ALEPLEEVIRWHVAGTRYQIRMDPADGLLSGGEEGVALTWMDARVGDGVVTPRRGQPVGIHALWYNALRLLADWRNHCDRPPDVCLGQAPRPSPSRPPRAWHPAGASRADL